MATTVSEQPPAGVTGPAPPSAASSDQVSHRVRGTSVDDDILHTVEKLFNFGKTGAIPYDTIQEILGETAKFIDVLKSTISFSLTMLYLMQLFPFAPHFKLKFFWTYTCDNAALVEDLWDIQSWQCRIVGWFFEHKLITMQHCWKIVWRF